MANVTVPTTQTYEKNSEVVRAVQNALKARGFSLKVDGIFGPETSRTISAWQKASGFPVTGKVDYGVLNGLKISPPGAAATAAQTQAFYNANQALENATKASHAGTPYDPTQAEVVRLRAEAEQAAQEKAALEAKVREAQQAVDLAKAKLATAPTPQAAEAAGQQLQAAEQQLAAIQPSGLFGLSWLQVGLAAAGLGAIGIGTVMLLKRRR